MNSTVRKQTPSPTTTRLKCPTCQRPVQWSDAFPFKPFCSERCKLIDLGAWASEQYGIPADTPPDQEF